MLPTSKINSPERAMSQFSIRINFQTHLPRITTALGHQDQEAKHFRKTVKSLVIRLCSLSSYHSATQLKGHTQQLSVYIMLQ